MPTNYRPISLLSQFDKIFEKLLFSRLFSYLDKNQLLNKNQFGFRPNSSTQFAISTIYDKLIKNIDNGLYTCCIFLDLSKAFDMVNHTILLEVVSLFWYSRHSSSSSGKLSEQSLSIHKRPRSLLEQIKNNNRGSSRILSWTSIVFALYQ